MAERMLVSSLSVYLFSSSGFQFDSCMTGLDVEDIQRWRTFSAVLFLTAKH